MNVMANIRVCILCQTQSFYRRYLAAHPALLPISFILMELWFCSGIYSFSKKRCMRSQESLHFGRSLSFLSLLCTCGPGLGIRPDSGQSTRKSRGNLLGSIWENIPLIIIFFPCKATFLNPKTKAVVAILLPTGEQNQHRLAEQRDGQNLTHRIWVLRVIT